MIVPPASQTANPLCFDATGTLIETAEPVGEVYHRVALEHGVDLPAWRIDDAFRRVLRNAPPRGLGGETPEERRESEIEWWFERIRQTFQATDSTARFDDFRAFAAALFEAYRSPNAWRPRPGAVAVLRTFEARGHPMGVISNFDHRLPDILKSLDIHRFFRVILLPFQTGSTKPDRALFEMAARALSGPLEQLTYIGDDDRTILGAIAGHGVQVIDVREIEGLEALPNLIARTAMVPESPRARLRDGTR